MPAPSSPRVGIAFLAYNQHDLVRRAAESCLAQQCEPLEIVLSDDASTDGTFDVLQQIAASYAGPHLVTARRNEVNVGIGEHYNRVVDATSADLLVTAAGDDWSVPTRVQSLIDAWEAGGCKADLLASHLIDLDHAGSLHDVIRVDDLSACPDIDTWAARRPFIIGAGHAFTRRMMRHFGPLSPQVFYEDQVMVFRAIALGGALTVDAPLVHYRRGGTSRRPRFDSAAKMGAWAHRQRGRELAEMEQILQDAAVAGCVPLVRASMEAPMKRFYYLQALNEAQTDEARWQVYRRAGTLPWWWRFRKLLHALFPNVNFQVKRALAVFHRQGP